MKLNGVFSAFFVLMTCAYASRYYKKQSNQCDSSSSSSSEIEICEPAFAECFKTEHKKHHKKKPVERCEVYEPERFPVCEPPRYIQHHKRHHHKGISKHCKRLLCDIKCLVSESYLYVGESICAQFTDLAACTKRSTEKSGDKAVEIVITNMKNLENNVIDIIKEPLHRATKKIEGVIVDSSCHLERAINEEFERYTEAHSTYFAEIYRLEDADLMAVVKDVAGGVAPTIKNRCRELQRTVIATVERATTKELRKIQEIGEDLTRDVEKDIRKAFNVSEALIKSLLEKVFEKECGHLLCLIEGRRRHLENRLRFVVISVEREIEKAISCVGSSKKRDCGVIRTKLAMFGDIGHHSSETFV